MPRLILIFLRKYRVIFTIVCSYNFYDALENLYCVDHDLTYIVSPRGKSIRQPFCSVNSVNVT